MTPLISGYEVTPEPWQWLYLAIICASSMLLCLPIATALRPRPPMWLAIPAVLGLLVWFTPIGLMGLSILHVLLLVSRAPIGASVVAAVTSCGALMLTMLCLHAQSRRRMTAG